MKKTLCILFASALLFGCAEDDFISTQQNTDRYISFTTSVTEMEDLDITRGNSNYNAAHHHEMTGANTPMFARFTQEKVINKYLKTGKQGVLGEQDDSPFIQVNPPSEGTEELSRGRRIDTSADFYDSFGLISFWYDVSETWTMVGNTITPYVYNEKVRKADQWRTAEFWPGTGRNLTFFAYAPYNAEGVTLSPSSQVGTPWLHHFVPENAVDESDLLISAKEHEVGNYNAIRHIDFKHICAGVRFAIGAQMAQGTIKKIQLADVYGEGWYHFGEAQWDSVKTERTFTLEQNFNIAKGDKNKLLTTGDNIFMMVPQVVPRNGRIIITINDGEDHDLVAYISKDQWDIGTTTTYWLSTLVTDGDTILSVAVENAPIAETGGTAQYEVSSYYTTAYGTRTALPWTAYYTIDDDPTEYHSFDPEALKKFTFSGGSTPTQSNDIEINCQIPRSVSQRTYQLKHAAPQNKDLAIGNGGSANCYVINAAGTYTFPCVYGNGLDNAGNARSTSDYLVNNFVNHAGTVISSLTDCPKIPESDINNACIVWQDAKYLINPNSLKIVTKNGFKCIQFTIDTLNICQGNALIAVRNANQDIMWSWHIWVTNHDMNNTIRINNQNHGSFGQVISDLAPAPLGLCERDTFKYATRNIHLTIVQLSSNDTARITISQSAGDAYIYSANIVYYQFARKDPMIGYGNSGNKRIYDNMYNVDAWGWRVNLQSSLQYPYIFYKGAPSDDWCTSTYWNLWNTEYTSAQGLNAQHVTKTVYDPCPAGFCLPRTGAFTGFATNGQFENTTSHYATDPEYGNGGRVPTLSAGIPAGNPTYIFMPAFGWKTNSGVWQNVTSHANYWTAGAYAAEGGRSILINPSEILPYNACIRSYHLGVWPVKED